MKASLTIFFLFAFLCENAYTQNDLNLIFKNIHETQIGKKIHIGFWQKNAAKFPEEGTIDFEYLEVVSSVPFSITYSIPAGQYAISAFIDLNGNGKLDTNFFGIPREPYCFSKNFRPKFSPPDFNDCKFDINSNTTLKLEFIQ